MNTKPADEVLKKPVCTWLDGADYAKFKALADQNGVTVSAYLRGIVIDVLAEETDPVVVREVRSGELAEAS